MGRFVASSSSTFETSTVYLGRPGLTTTDETTSRTHSVSGLLGLQFTPHERFAIFGEGGLHYSSTRREAIGKATSRLFGTIGSVGVVFYF